MSSACASRVMPMRAWSWRRSPISLRVGSRRLTLTSRRSCRLGPLEVEQQRDRQAQATEQATEQEVDRQPGFWWTLSLNGGTGLSWVLDRGRAVAEGAFLVAARQGKARD